MEITDVKVFPVNEEKLKAYITIVLDNSFLIRDLKVIQGPSGFFVAMPSKKRKDGTYKDLAHPINASTREKMEAVILEAYRKEAENQRVSQAAAIEPGEPPAEASETKAGAEETPNT